MRYIKLFFYCLILFSLWAWSATALASTGLKNPRMDIPAMESKEMGLDEIQSLVQKNHQVIIHKISQSMAGENVRTQKNNRAPELMINGDGHFHHTLPIQEEANSTIGLSYLFNLATEIDVYAGGKYSNAIKKSKKEEQISSEKLNAVTQEITLKAYVLLYDIYRNIKYKDFVLSSMHLREKEYERIEQLYENGVVLKSDLLRSKLYITDLQKDEVNIQNTINILSDEMCAILGMEESFCIQPKIENDLDYKVLESFDTLFSYALNHSPRLQIQHSKKQYEEIVLDELHADRRPHLKVYAEYGIGSPIGNFDNYQHQAGGEVGAKLSIPLSAFYKTNHALEEQRLKIQKQDVVLSEEEEELKTTLYELYTRYHESLINIDRAVEKIAMSEESHRILTNSYYNQQALLIDVLESETKSMESSFEWVEAVVDSQKYYWAIQQICGYLQ